MHDYNFGDHNVLGVLSCSPVTVLSFRFSRFINGGLNSSAFHLHNAILHAMATVTFYFLAQRLFHRFLGARYAPLCEAKFLVICGCMVIACCSNTIWRCNLDLHSSPGITIKTHPLLTVQLCAP